MRGSPRPMGSIRDQIEFNSVRMRVYLSPTVLRSCSSFFSSTWSTQHAANETPGATWLNWREIFASKLRILREFTLPSESLSAKLTSRAVSLKSDYD